MTQIDYQYPGLMLLDEPSQHKEQADEELLEFALRLTVKLNEFGITGEMKHICPGPVVTTYDFKPGSGVKVARIVGLAEDLCLAQTARSAGNHLVAATQRPPADVLAGIIKAGFLARISFKVSSKIDSRIAIGSEGRSGSSGEATCYFWPPTAQSRCACTAPT